ncbi:MAG: TonB-dependent receptor [Candidatus Solibacter usitatus]|nr:TonB-dependent receptor [Candidatus Solibacter usitatus]
MRRFTFSVCLVLCALAAPAAAQITGAITGAVLDSSGAVVTKADVLIKNLGTGAERKLITDSNGRYLAEALPVGLYEVAVSVPGFKKAIRTGLQLNVADRLPVEFRLEVGQMADTVSVTAEASLVKTETGDVSYLVTTKQITELAISNRTFLSLQQLVPGSARTAGDELGAGGFAGAKGFAMNGQRAKYASMMIDGVQNTDMGSNGGIMTYPGLETISEVKILMSNYSAEYGTAGSANTLVVTRAGTQDFHGAAFEFVRNDAFDARNFFAASKPPLRLNNFGYRIGGPVTFPGLYNKGRDKTFFLWSQEWRKRRSAQIVRAATPSPAMRLGDFSAEAARIGRPVLDPLSGQAFAGNLIPASRLNNNAKILLGHVFPAANSPGFLNFQQNFSVPEDFRQDMIRVDHNFTERTRVMFRFLNDSWVQTQPLTLWSGQSFPTISSIADIPGRNFVGKITKIVSPSVLTEVSFNYANNYGAREKNAVTLRGNYLQPNDLKIGRLFPLPADRPNKVPDLTFSSGWGGIASSYYPWWAHHDITTVSSLTAKNWGRHAVRFGGEYQFSRTPVQSQTNPSLQGSFSFSGSFTNHPHADFLLGQASTYGELDKFREPRYDYHNLELFIQDDWKISSRLTLNVGMRHFYIPHLYEKDDSLSVFRAERWDPKRAPTVLPDVTLAKGSGDLLNGITGVKDGLPRGLVANHPWKFAPRFGFAYDLSGNARTVLRGGYGIGYYRVEGNDEYSLVGNPPFANIVTVFNPPLDDPGRGSVGADRPKNLVTLDPVYQIPMIQTYSLGIQQQLAANTAITASYVGSRGTHLDRSRQLNYPGRTADGKDFDPRLNTREIAFERIAPFPGWGSINQREPTASSTYHSLQVDFNRAYHNGLRFQTAYTYSKAIIDADDFGATPQDPRNLRAERSMASFDRTHMAIVNYTYELPFFRKPTNLVERIVGGWELSGITEFMSGRPFNIGITGATVGLAGRPDVVAGTAAPGPKTVAQWFNTAAFRAPALGFFGNAGRNLVRGPGIHKWDIGVLKNFVLRENAQIQFRWEMFNTFNHTNFEGVSASLGAGNFGQVTSARDPRTMQFGLKFEF